MLHFSRLSKLPTICVINWLKDAIASQGAWEAELLPSISVAFSGMVDQQWVVAVFQLFIPSCFLSSLPLVLSRNDRH